MKEILVLAILNLCLANSQSITCNSTIQWGGSTQLTSAGAPIACVRQLLPVHA